MFNPHIGTFFPLSFFSLPFIVLYARSTNYFSTIFLVVTGDHSFYEITQIYDKVL